MAGRPPAVGREATEPGAATNWKAQRRELLHGRQGGSRPRLDRGLPRPSGRLPRTLVLARGRRELLKATPKRSSPRWSCSLRWCDGDAKKTSRVAIRGYTDNQSNESLLRTFSGGNDSEDQSSFRAEMCALKLALEAVTVAIGNGATGNVTIAVDCEAALKARFNCPSMPLFGMKLRTLAAEIRSRGVGLLFTWVPAHSRHPGWRSPLPAVTADHLRALNDAADRSAKECVCRRLRGFLRERWLNDAAHVKAWETAAIRASARAAQRLHEHLEACTAASTAAKAAECHPSPHPAIGS